MEIKDEYTYKELYNFWLGFTKEIESIFNSDLNEDIKKDLFNKKMEYIQDVIKNQNKKIKIGNKEEDCEWIYEKFNNSKIKDLFLSYNEINIFYTHFMAGIVFDFKAFSNIIYLMEKLINNIFEDHCFSNFTELSNGILKRGDVSKLLDFSYRKDSDKNEKAKMQVKKVAQRYPFIYFLTCMYMRKKEGGFQIREVLMKNKVIDWSNISIYYFLSMKMVFIISLLDIPCKSQNSSNKITTNKEVNISWNNNQITPENVKEIIKTPTKFNGEERNLIQYLLRNENCNLLMLKKYMNSNLINDNDNKYFLDELGFQDFYENIANEKLNSVDNIIDALNSIMDNIDLNKSSINISPYLEDEYGLKYVFKNDEEKNIYMSFYILLHVFKKCITNLTSKDFYKYFENINKNIDEKYFNLIDSAILNGMNGKFIFCLNLCPFVKEKSNSINSALKKNKKSKKTIDFLLRDDQLNILGSMRHGNVPTHAIELYGFMFFFLIVIFLMNEKVRKEI